MSTDPKSYVPDFMDMEAAKKNRGLFINRIFVQHMGEGMLRLNFGEVLDPDDPTYHTALVVSAANALTFAELIYRMAQAATAPPPIVQAPEPEAGDGE